jgi:hypothetical protein
MEITSVDEPHFLSWRSTSFPSFLLKAERVFDVRASSDGQTDFRRVSTWQAVRAESRSRCYETQAGPMAPLVRFCTGGMLDRAFDRFAADLKRHVEGRQ